MLASPLYASPAPFNAEGVKYTKDIDSFNKLLPPPIEFIEGSSSGTLAVPEGKYEPINATPKAGKPERPRNKSPPPSSSKASAPTAPSGSNIKAPPLHTGVIETTWPLDSKPASGLYNSGNTCFLNSALQCLMHTPPLLHMLLQHVESKCRVKSGVFCMACNLRKVASQAHEGRSAFVPQAISGKLQFIAKHMRKGRQEDSHEFLRYAIDALQKSCLAGQPTKIDHSLAETTWVHKIFGGRLRSRVSCRECGHNSDTFDSILDLSLDIHNMTGVKAALRKFVQPDTLKGADKYKCEKCKKPVIAEKRFTVHEAPMVLTVHLKRFTPMGRKITSYVEYEEGLTLAPYMSEGQHGPTYSLYGVICHAGGGPNSGHYFAYVKARSGKWCQMNDELVTHDNNNRAPVNLKNAYILFYLRNRGQGLDAAINAAPQTNGGGGGGGGRSIVAGMKKRQVRDEDEDMGSKVDKPFIGPRLPPSSPVASSSRTDPQADAIRKKIDAARNSKALAGLGEYASDSEGEEPAKSSLLSQPPSSQHASLPPSSPLPPATSSPVISPVTASTSTATASFSSPATAVSAVNFYGNTPNNNKRKHHESFGNDRDRAPKRSSLGASLNPFGNNRLTSGSLPKQYGKRGKGKPRGI
ncbi:ubiquitin carboxyl-terminal hydrolase [Favolaschia claudopus]|uniref:Ubiquitin carboxyl-terminal hydrolase n=1 Tax=Favolaschia claudopus TaxID=2862362 RepID=A0AAW0EA01_9AGAR